MNYLRGAIQYYKDLPPINPATLTGAIDVIVVRTDKDEGSYELASTPFHIRFGKWQILRPGDKKVLVSVNGKAVPFQMKIGEAGEAFFVFETDEDVSDDLLTSPIASPLIEASNNRDGGRLEGEYTSPTLIQTSPSASEEPDFLDLDAGEEQVSPDNNTQTSDISKANAPSVETPTTIFDKTREIGETIWTATKESQKVLYDHIQDDVHILSDLAHGKGGSINPAKVDGDIGAPQVDYKDDIVIDTAGYHTNNHRREKVLNEDNSNSTVSPSQAADSPISSEVSSPTSPDSLSSPKTIKLRGSSAPPQIQTLSSSPTEYEWEWGAFPQPSPLKPRFSEPRDAFQRASSVPPALDGSSIEQFFPPAAEEVVFGLGGLLRQDRKDSYQFILDLDSVQMTFQLSLCGLITGSDEVEDISRFQLNRVSYRRFMVKEDVVKSDDLVICWGEKYISRADSSPLFGALLHWRENTLSSQGYTSDGEPPTSGDELSGEEEEVGLRQRHKTKSTWSSWWSRGWTDRSSQATRVTDGETGSRPIIQPAQSEPLPQPSVNLMETEELDNLPMKPEVKALTQPSNEKPKRYVKTLRLTSEQLISLDFKKGANDMTFSLTTSGVATCTARIFLWDSTDHIVVSDIDGTITKSDALGHVLTLMGRDWTHLGVAKLYTDICRNGYKIMYLTSRAIGQADSTRDYLKGINQNNHQLPEGPVVMSPDRLIASLHREVIMRKPEVFKMACLRDIARLFSGTSRNPFYAGFGNRITDALSYRSVNIPSTRIFTIDSTGEVKTELLERAGYKSSYIHMSDLVDHQFPPVHRKWQAEYIDFNYWRPAIEEPEFPDLSPPSPTLSARSDTSNQSALSRLRQFSLGKATARSVTGLPSTRVERAAIPVVESTSLRSMSSLGKLRSLVGYPGSEPSSFTEEGGLKAPDRSQRRLSDGMPGSLSHESFLRSMDDLESGVEGDVEEPEEEECSDDGEAQEDIEEFDMDEVFDEDLLAASEMKNVSFL